MEKLFYDIHIHSCLSPCADDESVPSDIAALSKMLGLDVAAITDHNSCKNCPAFFAAADAVGLIPIAGMELSVAEEFHVLCLFSKLEAAMEFDKYVHSKLMKIENNEKIFGKQLIVDSTGEMIAQEQLCLINATEISFYSLPKLIKNYDGIIVPAHIDRSAFSLITTLGDVPSDSGFSCVEIRYPESVQNLKIKYPYLEKCRIIHNSDAHNLESISLPLNFTEAEEKNAEAFLKAISSKPDSFIC